jgi:hypothetical protein
LRFGSAYTPPNRTQKKSAHLKIPYQIKSMESKDPTMESAQAAAVALLSSPERISKLVDDVLGNVDMEALSKTLGQIPGDTLAQAGRMMGINPRDPRLRCITVTENVTAAMRNAQSKSNKQRRDNPKNGRLAVLMTQARKIKQVSVTDDTITELLGGRPTKLCCRVSLVVDPDVETALSPDVETALSPDVETALSPDVEVFAWFNPARAGSNRRARPLIGQTVAGTVLFARSTLDLTLDMLTELEQLARQVPEEKAQ